MKKLTKNRALFYLHKKIPHICKDALADCAPSIHSVINTKGTAKRDDLALHNTLITIKSRLKRMPAKQALVSLSNSVTDPRREARARKWIKKLELNQQPKRS